MMPAIVPDLLTATVRRIARFLPGRGGSIPLEDLVDNGEYRIRAELPGITADKNLDVTVTDGRLTIHAERTEQRHAQQRTEFRYGTLRRSLHLPAGAIENRITARLEDGILAITVPTGKRIPTGRPVPIGRTVPSSKSIATKRTGRPSTPRRTDRWT